MKDLLLKDYKKINDAVYNKNLYIFIERVNDLRRDYEFGLDITDFSTIIELCNNGLANELKEKNNDLVVIEFARIFDTLTFLIDANSKESDKMFDILAEFKLNAKEKIINYIKY